ncbi:MAG: PAS domain S-box protein [Desulfobacteraceae bacterium]|nr:MAG: PAS domain S-box protein [Desulfobacteraceae bacterium]
MKKAGTTNIRNWFWMLLIVLGIITGGLAYYRYEAGYIRDRKYQEIAAVAELKVGQIRQWRWERLADARLMTKSPYFQKAVTDWLGNPFVRDMQADLQARLNLVEKEHLYAEVLLCDLNGHILISSRPEEEHSIPPITEELEKAVAEGKALLGECFRGPNGEAYLDTLSPVPNLAGGPVVVLVLRSRMDDLLYPLIRSWPIPSQTAESLLVRREGRNVLFLNELRHRPASALSLTYPLTRTDIPAVQAVLGKQGRFEGNDYRSEKVLADLRPVPGSRWFMVVKVDTREILAEARYRGWVTLVFVILFVVFAVVINAYGHRQRQAALYRELFRTERKRSDTLEEFRITLYSIGDGVITTDKEGRVRQMNRVAEELTGWSESTACGKFIDDVFPIINEKTRIKVENPVHRVLREGEVVNLANHTLLVALDGSERPIADSGAPICDDQDAIIGVVLVFRDQTQERAAEENLRNALSRSRRWSEEVSALLEGSKAVLNHTDFTKAARRIFDICRSLINAKAGYVAILSADGMENEVLFLESGGLPCGVDPELPMPIRGLREQAYSLKKTVYENDFSVSHWVKYLPKNHVRLDNVLFAPIQLDNQVLGILGVSNKPGGFTDEDVRQVSAFAELTAVSLRNSRTLSALTTNEKKLQEAHDKLEQRVLERTQALTLSNEQLSREIEERHQAEARMRKSKEMLQAVFDGISDPLVLLDKDMRVKVLNKSAIAYFGLTETREIIGEFCYKAFKDESNLCKGCRIQAAVFKTEDMNFERKGFMDPLRDEKVFIYPIYQKNGEPAEIIYRINDITERKIFEKRMIQNEKLASLGVLVSSIVHEINNPNAFITFNTPILKEYIEQLIGMIDDDSKANPELELFNMSYSDFRMDIFRLIGNIEHGSERIGAIVSSLKEFSRTQYKGNGKQVDLTTVAEKALSICRAKVKKTVKSFTVNIPADFPRIHADPIALEQILINLLINAAQAADKEDSWIRLSAAIGRTWLDHTIIEVQDNGCGIDEKNMNNIFDPFFSTKPPVEGTGLGLYVCHDLVMGLGGRIEVESKAGEFSIFRVIIPNMDRRKEKRT